jgi:predicted enzyme related to lactoylglutathione lyase
MEVMLAWYQVSDLEAAKKFYGDVMGLNKVFEMDGWVEFSHKEGGVAIGLSANGSGQSGATIVLRVDDMDRTREELSRNGVEFIGEVEEIPGVVKLCTFRDSSGNQLQLAQPLMA